MLLKSPYLSRIHTEISVGERIRHLALKTLQLKIQRGKQSVMGVKKSGRKEGGRGGGKEKRDLLSTEHKITQVVCVCVFYQVGHALENTQDLWVTQLVVGKVKDTEFQTFLEMLNVFHGL